MIKSLIVAKSDNNVIGKDNDLVWHMPEDQKYFKRTTLNHYVIMGRKTFESMNKPLPKRTNVVVTRRRNYRPEGAIVVNDLSTALEIAAKEHQQEVFILGGGEIYKQSIPLVDRMYITEVKAEFEGDTFFPELDYSGWKEIKREEHQPDLLNPYPYAFVVWERK
ncbi:MAG: dihydrofolate reductase [Candidatus Cyclobacteriaceae bacterium M3_2C_046]